MRQEDLLGSCRPGHTSTYSFHPSIARVIKCFHHITHYVQFTKIGFILIWIKFIYAFRLVLLVLNLQKAKATCSVLFVYLCWKTGAIPTFTWSIKMLWLEVPWVIQGRAGTWEPSWNVQIQKDEKRFSQEIASTENPSVVCCLNLQIHIQLKRQHSSELERKWVTWSEYFICYYWSNSGSKRLTLDSYGLDEAGESGLERGAAVIGPQPGVCREWRRIRADSRLLVCHQHRSTLAHTRPQHSYQTRVRWGRQYPGFLEFITQNILHHQVCS